MRFAAAAGVAMVASTASSADSLLQHPVLRTYQPMQIALPDFVAGSLSQADAAHAIPRIIASDLKQSGVFAPINRSIFAEKNASVDEVPEFADWRAINAQELVIGRITSQPDGSIKVEFRLWEVFRGTQLAGRRYTVAPDDFNRLGHAISEDIYERITGKKRTFNSSVSP
jgi:TolB protein